MFFYICPSCGARAYSAANASAVGTCPRCGKALAQETEPVTPAASAASG
jgi:ribosomal protein L37AE/L43A